MTALTTAFCWVPEDCCLWCFFVQRRRDGQLLRFIHCVRLALVAARWISKLFLLLFGWRTEDCFLFVRRHLLFSSWVIVVIFAKQL